MAMRPALGTALDDQLTSAGSRPVAVCGHALVPYTGRGTVGDRVLVQVVTSQSISVTLDCSR
jgi:hypothetical protein